MDINKLVMIVSLIIALSIASERLVEIIKGLKPWLNNANPDKDHEGYRCAALQALAVVAGLVTAFLSSQIIPTEIINATGTGVKDKALSIIALGLLASGGSGFWNSVLTYMLKIKDIKSLTVKNEKLAFQGQSAMNTQTKP